MPSAWTTLILVQSSTALGDTQDTVIANHESNTFIFLCSPSLGFELGTSPRDLPNLDQNVTIDAPDRSAMKAAYPCVFNV